MSTETVWRQPRTPRDTRLHHQRYTQILPATGWFYAFAIAEAPFYAVEPLTLWALRDEWRSPHHSSRLADKDVEDVVGGDIVGVAMEGDCGAICVSDDVNFLGYYTAANLAAADLTADLASRGHAWIERDQAEQEVGGKARAESVPPKTDQQGERDCG